MRSTRRVVAVVIAIAALAVLGTAGSVDSETCTTCTTWWHVGAHARPSYLPVDGDGVVVAEAVNRGDASAAAVTTITAKLPAGIALSSFVFHADTYTGEVGEFTNIATVSIAGLVTLNLCAQNGQEVTCTYPTKQYIIQKIEEAGFEPETAALLYEAGGGADFHPLGPFDGRLELELKVQAGTQSGEEVEVDVEEAGASAPTSARQPLTVSNSPVPFGVEEMSLVPEEVGGATDLLAGSHPFQLTTGLWLNTSANGQPFTPGQPRTLSFALPPGLVADAQAAPQCPYTQFAKSFPGGNGCLAESIVGANVLTLAYGATAKELTTTVVPVFNLTPAPGEPARFGFTFESLAVTVDTGVRTGRNYGATATVSNTVQYSRFVGSQLTIWGVPAAAQHDGQRGFGCVWVGDEIDGCPTSPPAPSSPTPFLTLPTSCQSPFHVGFEGTTWPVPTEPSLRIEDGFTLSGSGGEPLSLEGCQRLDFSPQIQLTPDTQDASSPLGPTVKVKLPQTGTLSAGGTAESAVKSASVTLPAGVTLNPASASGLQACTETEVGFEGNGSEEGVELALFSPLLPEPSCPEGAKLATVAIHTPLLPNPLKGALYLASPAPEHESGKNPFDSLVAVYMIAEDPVSGVLVKLPGEVSLNSQTGQVTATFSNTPQLPFEELELQFLAGPRAALASPAKCGAYATKASFTPWSGGPAVETSTTFEVTAGPGGGPCPGDPAFAPTFEAGTTNNSGGSFSPLTVAFSRKDGEQPLGAISMHLPPGLAGMISAVQPCAEAQAAIGDCPAASKIGHVRVSAGVGSEPVVVPQAGKPEDPVYLTGPYKGAPFGVAIVVPAEAGPFNLDEDGHPVVVRGKIEVDPHTAEVSIEAEPPPTMLRGVPVDLRNVEVVIDKSGFVFNPTNCEPMSITGSIGSSEGASEPVSSRFQAADCASLPFKPTFQVTTHKGHTRRNGGYLRVNVTSGSGQANLKSVFVELPKLLPSRTETLKGACSEQQFAEDPAGCPAASQVGTAVVHTPVLPVPLTGPAIFVSHGGAAFPDLDLVLQGDGVTIEQVGNTNIVNGVTSSDFKTIPDVPVSSVELTLPEGPHSALAATGNLCFQTASRHVTVDVHGKAVHRTEQVEQRRTLDMPTTITGQNGAVIKQTTKIAVEGCGSAKGTASSAARSSRKRRSKS